MELQELHDLWLQRLQALALLLEVPHLQQTHMFPAYFLLPWAVLDLNCFRAFLFDVRLV